MNKIDLKHANPEKVIEQLNGLFEIERDQVLKISAKMGIGIQDVLEAVVHIIPPPTSDHSLTATHREKSRSALAPPSNS